jgi:hypothetical protein
MSAAAPSAAAATSRTPAPLLDKRALPPIESEYELFADRHDGFTAACDERQRELEFIVRRLADEPTARRALAG